MSGNEKKYKMIIDWIINEIEIGKLKNGDRVMPEEQIAKKFDLSRQTVRRAMSDLVEMKILSRVQGSGTYVGTKQEKKRNATKNIAVVSTFYDDYIFPSILKGIGGCLSENDYTMQLTFTDNRIENERRILKDILYKNDIDGLIIEPSESNISNGNTDLYDRLFSMHIPVIFFNDIYKGLNAPCVRLDDHTAAKEATTALLQSGHRKIAAIFKADDGQGCRRYKGYVDALSTYDIKVSRKNIFWIDSFLLKEMNEIENYILKRIDGCTAVMCYNDEVAKQVIEMALRSGINVPDELSVISIDNSSLATECKVPITSFDHPKEKLGRKVASNLLKMIENPLYNGNYLFKAEAVWRDSVRKIEDEI